MTEEEKIILLSAQKHGWAIRFKENTSEEVKDEIKQLLNLNRRSIDEQTHGSMQRT